MSEPEFRPDLAIECGGVDEPCPCRAPHLHASEEAEALQEIDLDRLRWLYRIAPEDPLALERRQVERAYRARVWRWLLATLALFWLAIAALVLTAFPVLP